MMIDFKGRKIEIKEKVKCYDTIIYITEDGIYYHSQDKYHSIRKLYSDECIMISKWRDVGDIEYSIYDAYIIGKKELGKQGLLARPCNNNTWFETPKIEIKFIVGEKGATWHTECQIAEIIKEV